MKILTPDEIDFDKYMRDSEPKARVKPADSWETDVLHELAPATQEKHASLPFKGSWLRFRPGEVTIWGGFNNSGKSLLQGQVAITLAAQGEPVCIASFEMKPPKTLARIMRQVARHEEPTRAEVGAFFHWTKSRLWLYDQQGMVDAERMIAVVRYCAEELGVMHVCIDSLMKCIRGEDDYNAQKEFVDRITAVARDTNVHIHLVHHLKKGDGDERMPTRMDLRGSSAIADQVDNVLLLWRNKKKERESAAGKEVNHDDADSVLICDKQRNGSGWNGAVRLWMHSTSLQFIDYRHGDPVDLMHCRAGK